MSRHPGSTPPRPDGPCTHAPGSEGKILALAARAAAGLPLFRPDDAPAAAAGAAPAPARGPARARDLPRGVTRLRGRFRARAGGLSLGSHATAALAEAALRRWRGSAPAR